MTSRMLWSLANMIVLLKSEGSVALTEYDTMAPSVQGASAGVKGSHVKLPTAGAMMDEEESSCMKGFVDCSCNSWQPEAS